MAFKSFSQYQADKNGEFFVLPNDKDYADVIFLYRNTEDVLVADVHYITSSTYKGYVHCCGTGCPACNYGERGIRLDHKLFIPLYNIQKNKIEFWDRSTFFEQVLQKAVFASYPVPWQTVFRITRRGEAGSRDTKYDIVPIARNSSMTYDKILSDLGVTLPDHYSVICKEMSAAEMSAVLTSKPAASDLQDYGYVPIPRGETAPEITVPTPQYSAPPEVAPPIAPPEVAPVGSEMPEYVPGMAAPVAPPVEAAHVPFEQGGAVNADDSGDPLDDVAF